MKTNDAREHITGLFEWALKSKLVKPEVAGFLLPAHVITPNVLISINLKEVLKRQIKRLISLGYPETVLRDVIPPISIFSLLVVPSYLIPLKLQIKMAGLQADREDIYGDFIDLCKNKKKPYWIYYINEENFGFKHTADSFRKELINKGRRGLTFTERVNLFAQWPNFFINNERGSHSFSLFGSRDESSKAVPEITVFSIDTEKGVDAGPNCYHGDRGNNTIALTCRD